MVDQVQKSMTLMPEYQEKYLKDLLANVYNVDEETGEVSGIASFNPLYGQGVTQGVTDDDGNPVYVKNADGSIAVDQYGNQVQEMSGGVAPPDITRFTTAQVDALRRLTGYNDPETGEQVYEGSIGAYQPYIDSGLGAYNKGLGLAGDSTGMYDLRGQLQYDAEGQPMLDAQGNPVRRGGVQDYYDPYVDDVIGGLRRDINKQSDMRQQKMNAEAVSAGAFSNQPRRDRQRADLAEASDRAFADAAAPIRSQAFTAALSQSQNAFSDQAKRQQTAGTLFQNLGTGIGALGEAASALGAQDFNTQFNAGALEQDQYQKEYDVQRSADLEEAYEPFARFSYMRDILQGMGGGGSTLAATGSPQASSLANILANTGIYQGSRGMGTGGLGAIKNTSGA